MDKRMVNASWSDHVRIEGIGRAVSGPASDWLHYHDCYRDLLEVCQLALRRIESDIEIHGRKTMEANLLRAAIRKATEEQP